MDLQLLVGLGNPGPKYAETRHNVGFMVLERLAREGSVSFRSQPRLQGLMAEIGSGESRLRLLMPQTYMNDSGRSIRAALDWFRLDASQLLVLVDDMDLPLGRLRLRASGSAGGHNGLRSAIHHLGRQDFARLRIGIGAPPTTPQSGGPAPYPMSSVASPPPSAPCWRRCSTRWWPASTCCAVRGWSVPVTV